jgi:WD40 repeat protein
VRLWDWTKAKEMRSFSGSTAEVNCVTFSPDGRTLASGGWDRTVRLWDPQTGMLRVRLEGHTEFVRDLVFTTDGKTLVSSGKDGVIRLWDVEGGKLGKSLEGHQGLVRSLALSPDGKLLASAGRDGTLNVWDFQAGKVRAGMQEGVLGFQVVAFAPNGKTLATGGIDRNVSLWDVGRILEAHLNDRPLTPAEARKKVGEKIIVEMTVRAAKDRLETRGEIYLDSETDFRDEKNFAVVITRAGAASLKEAGIGAPAEHFRDKTIRATGTVKEMDRVPRIEIDDVKQIQTVD